MKLSSKTLKFIAITCVVSGFVMVLRDLLKDIDNYHYVLFPIGCALIIIGIIILGLSKRKKGQESKNA